MNIAKKTGVDIADSPEQLAMKNASSSLPVSLAMRMSSVLLNRISTSIKPGTIVVDTSTVASDTTKKGRRNITQARRAFVWTALSRAVWKVQKMGHWPWWSGVMSPCLIGHGPTLEAIAANIAYIGPTGKWTGMQGSESIDGGRH